MNTIDSLPGPVLVMGTGLMGTSVGLALARRGVPVHLADTDPEHVATAAALGAGQPDVPVHVGFVVVAVPPDHLGAAVASALRRWPDAAVTDIGSVKSAPLAQARAAGAAVERYVGGHPMAGSERSGPAAASADLFDGRAWAVTPHEGADPRVISYVRTLAELCGASVVTMTPADHDAAVARVSHLPHLMSVLAAARLVDGSPNHLALAGQGLRDVTRIAAGEPGLWAQIVSANARELSTLLAGVRDDIDLLLRALGTDGTDGTDGLCEVLERGRSGTRLIPGKHGAPQPHLATVYVQVPDRAGGLARLFQDAGESGVNVEDLHIDHDPGRPVGLVELAVRAAVADHLVIDLTARGWTAHR